MRSDLVRCLFVLLAAAMLAAAPANADESLVFISAFAPAEEGAIHAFRLDCQSGRLTPVSRTADVENPFFLAVSPGQKFLYAIHARKFGGKEHEEVAAYAIAARTGQLTLLTRQSTLGSASCYLAVDATGKTLLVANYATGSVASLPVRDDGSLDEAASFFQHAGASVDPARQAGPHAHSIVASLDNRFAYAADLGLDELLIYRLDAARATLAPNQTPRAKTPPGAGPRHLAFHPKGKYLYAINELANSVTRFDYDRRSGALRERQTVSTLPREYQGKSYCADLKITPDGRFLYGTNRGHDSIAAFRIGDDGRLTLVGIEPSLGRGPQNLAISPGGELLLCANMPGGNVAVFRIDPQTGGLTSVGPPVSMPFPSCIRLLPAEADE
ncbi:MAG: lactonase family protein [Planctomycetota bacterium]|nr:lactonase family protein [Planctomycetota bacterium]